MTKAFKIGIGNLLLEFLAHTLVFLCTLNSARAVTACPLQALFNCLYCFFVGIKCYFHLLTPQFLRRLPLISSLDYTIYRNPKIVKRLALRAGQRQGGVFRIPPPYLWTPLSPQRVKGCSPLTSPKKKSKRKKASRCAKRFFLVSPICCFAADFTPLLNVKSC